MRRVGFDTAASLDRIGELVRLTTQAGGPAEIRERGLELAAGALRATGAALLLSERGSDLRTISTWGAIAPRDIADLAEECVSSGDVVEETGRGSIHRVALPLSEGPDPKGAVVFEGPLHRGPIARSFARSAVSCIAAALVVARRVEDGRAQGEMLSRRNVEMRALSELVTRVQGVESEDEMLQAALDVVLENLGLDAGWIFWGETSRGRLELAASRGIAEEFTKQARESGIGVCLCVDVFETGKLRVARNTMDCPRLPDLVRGTEPMTHACIPLRFERGILGVMNIANRPGSLFTPHELQFLETVGSQVCLAVDKARSARAESRRNAEARALVSLSRAIGGSLELDRVIAAVGEYARELLSADRSAIFLGQDVASLEFAYLAGRPMPGLEMNEQPRSPGGPCACHGSPSAADGRAS
jgi:hypothetical protein